MEKIVVTRHKVLVQYLMMKKMIDNSTKVITHANPDEIKGKHVIGILPYWLACHAEQYTQISLRLPPEKRDQELTVEDIDFYIKKPETYVVRRVSE